MIKLPRPDVWDIDRATEVMSDKRATKAALLQALKVCHAEYSQVEAELHKARERLEDFECNLDSYARGYVVGILAAARNNACLRWDLDAIDGAIEFLKGLK